VSVPLAPRGLLVDYVGVMTCSVGEALACFGAREGMDAAVVREVVLADYAEPDGTIARLESGTIDPAEADEILAERIGRRIGRQLDSLQLCRRLMQGLVADEAMVAAVQTLRGRGIRTALLSNSWGVERYDTDQLAQTFDVAILSRDLALRKPDKRLFEHALKELGVSAEQTAFVDDLPANVEGAAASGIHAVVHVNTPATVSWLADLFRVPL
jgi:putative hydrolase of the HAD superfamily